MQRIISGAGTVVLVIVVLFFWLTPPSERDFLLTLIGLGVTALCTLSLSVVFHRPLRTWRGFGVLLALHIAAQAWLQWQWDLWGSPITLIRNLNVIAGLIVFATLIAMFVSLVLLLIFRDASVIALTVAWLGYPVLLIGTALRYRTLDALNAAPLREQIVWLTPTCLLPFLAVAGGIAFLAHFIWLVVKEITAREMAEG